MPLFSIPGAIFRTTAFRIALANTATFVAIGAVLSVLLFTYTTERVLEQIDTEIAMDSQVLVTTFQQHGEQGLIEAIARRTDQAGPTEGYYQLRAADGRVLAGNLPPLVAPDGPGWVSVLPDINVLEDGMLRSWAGHLPDGSTLLVGRNPSRLDDVEDTLYVGLAASEAATLLVGLLMGYFVSRRALRGVAIVADAAGRIGAGNLTHRIPGMGAGTEIDTIGQAVNLMLDRIGTLTDSLRQVTDDIAHDLRTPLGRLRQDLERAVRSAQTVTEYHAAVDAALDEADAIIATFNALLRIAQVEGQERRHGFAEVDLSALVQKLAEIYGPTGEEAGLPVCSEIAPGVRVLGDTDLLGQMISNLIENALRHTPPGTPLSVLLTPRRTGGPRLVIADAGPGIPAVERDRVLGRFVRLDASRHTPGTGLGLALVKAVADLHGITLTLGDARPGLRVTLDFPRYRAAVASKLSEDQSSRHRAAMGARP